MRFIVYSLYVFVFGFLTCTVQAQNPFDSSQKGYPKGLPFTAIELKDETSVRVQYDNKWFSLKTIQGFSVKEIMQKCEQEEWDLKRRIEGDLMQIVRLMGKEVDDSVKLVLIDDKGIELKVDRAKVSEDNRNRAMMYALSKRNPFLSGVPGYPNRSPFTAIKWDDDSPLVEFRDQWYRPVTLQGVSYKDIVAKCKSEGWELKRRFTEDMVQILRLMGKDIDQTIDLELLDTNRKAQKFTSVKMEHGSLRLPRRRDRAGRAARKFDAESIKSDLDSLQTQLESQFAYLKANGFDYVSAINEIRGDVESLNSESKLALAIKKKVINQFIDGHANVSGARISSRAFLPFLIEVSGDRYVAINEDRQSFVDSEHPYIESIDGKSIGEWIKVAADYSPKGSPQYVRRNGLRVLRTLPQLRADVKLPKSNELTVVLAKKDSSETITRLMEFANKSPTYRLWPRGQESRLMDEGFGYLRIVSMNRKAVEQIRDWMPKFKDSKGLIVDVRNNGGGIRLPLLELAAHLMRPDDPPRIGNVAKYRLYDRFKADHLSDARYVYRASSSRFDDREKAAIVAFKKNFRPEWEPDTKEFSEWHYLVLAKREDDKRYFYDKPVVVLCDEKCFSATDIFLGALKGLPNVTLVGQPSGGGSARSESFELKNSGIEIRCASMASFQPDGRLYDTRGVEPDVLVTRPPDYFLIGGEDVILKRAIELLTN